MTSITVIIPTYGRPAALTKCLEGLATQTRPADEVIVVTRRDDQESQDVVRASTVAARLVFVETPGVLAAMAEGLLASTSDWVAFTDDDAVASPPWLSQIEQLSQNNGVVGVGGRDVLEDHGVPRPTTLTLHVGILGRSGRFVGNHHRGTGPVRSVAMLKGVNGAYDARFLGIPVGLFGQGAQAHFEVAIGLDLAKHGTLLYDPQLTVRHAPDDRLDGDRRQRPSKGSIADVASNAVLACGVQSVWLATCRTAYSFVIGDASVPGIVRFLVGISHSDIRRRFLPSLFGTLRGFARALTGNGVSFVRR
jgi:glycosyltransferase involved in cell wall biosynthesis